MASTQSRRQPVSAAKKTKKKRKNAKLSRQRQPDGMSLEAWQAALRREFGRSAAYQVRNLGEQPIFSTFAVSNPTSKRTYRVTIRPPCIKHQCDAEARPIDGGFPAATEHHCSCPDFTVNTLGTCKHIEFLLGRLERRHGKRQVHSASRLSYSQIYVRYGRQRQVIFHPGSSYEAGVSRSMAGCFDRNGVLTELGYERLPKAIAEVKAAGHDLRVSEDAMEMVARVRDRKALRARLDNAYPRGLTSATAKKLLRTDLYPYQRQGALFAARAGRALIADEMGLGKTVQAIAVAELLGKHGSAQRVLIVCPTSLKHQWAQEIARFTRPRNGASANGEQLRVIEGPLHVREAAYAADGFYKIVNYDVIHRDLEAIRRWSPDLVILDEAQRIKNWKTRAAMTVKQIDSPYALVLTGTPLENRLEELYSIVEFVDRHRLGPMFGFLAKHQHVDESGRVIGYRDLDHIGQTLEPIMLRRTKKQVLKELPERLEKRLFVPMTAQQQAIHDENRDNVARIVAKWRRYRFLSDADQRRLMISLQNMRMACNSTYLLDRESEHGAKIDEAEATLSDLLEDRDVKVVVFSQWVGTHELLARRCAQRGWGHVQFNGSVPGPKRKQLVQQFREDDDCRLFLSTDAGGVGLNLQNAGAVVVMDQPWNPAVLEQRIGRVHRLGQKMPVRVVHLIAQGTIEEGMLNLLGFKQSVFAGVLDGGAGEVFLGGTKLNRFIESVDKATGTIPAPSRDSETASEESTTSESDRRTEGSGDPLQQAWSKFASAAMGFLAPLAAPASSGKGNQSEGLSIQRLMGRDETTGQPCLKLPLPSAKVLSKLTDVLHQWAAEAGDDRR